MKICELKIPNYEDRADLCAILAVAGYKVSIDEHRNWPMGSEYFVIVEDKEADHERT
jgi:hypothetical protein